MGKINLMTHVVAGYPTMDECEKIVLAMAESGVSFIEIQIPFSDPIADGPTIMQANEKALADGVKPDDCFKLIERLKGKVKIPILIMSYFNILFQYDLLKFCKQAEECGVYGLIIPDIPLNEEKYEHYLEICKKHNLHAIQIISPITTTSRLKKIAKVARGFVYCVSRFGTTGESHKLAAGLSIYMKNVRKYIKVPLALGFGISSKEQVAAVLKHANIAVIGSKIVNLCNSCGGEKMVAIKKFLRSCAENWRG